MSKREYRSGHQDFEAGRGPITIFKRKIKIIFILLYIMLVNKYYYGYSNKKKRVTGKGFVDSLSSIFKYHKISDSTSTQNSRKLCIRK